MVYLHIYLCVKPKCKYFVDQYIMVSHFIKRNNKIYSQSFSVRHAKLPHFLKLWHHHQEMELVLILKGKGMRFVGDSMEPFGPRDFVLLGDELPHKWQNDMEYFSEMGLEVEAIIIHFEKRFLANALEETVEFSALYNLLESSERGIRFTGDINKKAEKLLWKIVRTAPGLKRLILLLDLLGFLAHTKRYSLITSPGYINSVYERDTKLKRVKEFVMNNFQMPIGLNEIAGEIGMNKTAFCRYFKKTTGITFFTYLNEIRIGYACKLLQKSNDTIAKIGYESGFNNLSNFNQKFKQFTGRTPSGYLRMME